MQWEVAGGIGWILGCYGHSVGMFINFAGRLQVSFQFHDIVNLVSCLFGDVAHGKNLQS